MAITLPDFTALPQATPQATGGPPQYPAENPTLAGEAVLAKGIGTLGGAFTDIGAYQDIAQTKMNKASADADFSTRTIPITEALKVETDPAKITELRAKFQEALETSSQAFGDNSDARNFWLKSHAPAVATGQAEADLRNTVINRDNYVAGMIKKNSDLVREAAGSTDPQAVDIALHNIDQSTEAARVGGYMTATAAAEHNIKLKNDLIAGRIGGLAVRKQFDEADALLAQYHSMLGPVAANHLENIIRVGRERGDVAGAIKGYLNGGAGYVPPSSLGTGGAGNPAVSQAIAAEAKAQNYDPTTALATAAIESKMGRDLGGRGNIFQLGDPEWASVGGGRKGDPTTDIRNGVSFLKRTEEQLAVALGRKPEPWEVYLGHQQGVAGATALLNNPSLPAGNTVSPENISRNGGDPNAPASQFIDKWRSSFQQAAAQVGTGAVVQGQGGATRNLPIAPTVNSQLDRAANTVGGVTVEVFSGGQPSEGPNRVGSHRHDEGDAADIQLRDTKTGQLLDMRKPEDQARMKNFITAAVAAGATGVGAAEDYMGPHGIHIGGGPPAAWGAGGKAANAPGWVKTAFDTGRTQAGTLTPPGTPPAAPAAPATAAAAPTGALVPGQAALGNTPLDTLPGGPKAMQSAAPIAITSGAHKGKYLLLPGTAADGSALTEDQALDQYEKDGKHLGIFNSPGDATAYANRAGTGAAPAAAASSEEQGQYDEAFKRWRAANPESDPKVFTDYRTRMGLYVPSAAAPSAGAAPAASAAARPAGPQTFDAAGGDSIGLSAIKNADLPGTFADDKSKPVYTGADRKTPVKGRDAGQAMTVGGRDPTGNLDYVNAHPEEFQGKRVFWSTGLMNAGKTAEEARAALPKVREQLDTLVNGLKAQVVLVGVDKGKFAPLNKELDALASEYKIPFAGALPTTDVHPGAAAMKEYARKAAQLLPASSGDTGPPPAPATAGTDTYVTPGAEGGDYGGGGEPTETPAATGTEPAAVSGGSREVKSPELITPSATPAPATAGTTGGSITKMPPGGWTPHVDVTEIERQVDANAAAGRHSETEAAKIKAGLIAELHRRDALVKPQRDELANNITGGLALLKDGRAFDYNPDEIRHYYGKPEADKIIQALDDARDAGRITSQVAGASQEQIDSMRADIQAGLDKGGAVGADKRKLLADHFETVAKKREAALDKALVETETNRYFGAGPGLAAISQPDFGQQPARDPNDLVQRVQADIDYGRLRPEVGALIQRAVVERTNVLNAAEHNDKVALNDRINATTQALADGKDVEAIDPTVIRHYFTADEADKRIQALADATESGGYRAQIRNSSAADNAERELKLRQSLDDRLATDYPRRAKQYAAYRKELDDHEKKQLEDPGGYTQITSPLVAQKFQDYLVQRATKPSAVAVASDNAETAHANAFAAFAQATLAEQDRRGVPSDMQQILSKGQAATIAAQIANMDTKDVSAAAEMRHIARGYGQYWPRVYGELVNNGKMPAPYQVLATMDREDQLVAADDLSMALKHKAAKGGAAAAKQDAGLEVRTKLDDAIDTELEDLKHNLSLNTGGLAAYDNYHSAVKTLAEYYGARGQGQSEAIKNASNGIVRNKYDFVEFGPTTVRVPKGIGESAIIDATNQIKNDLQPQELGPIPIRGQALAKVMKPEQAQRIWMEGIRNGGWANSEDGSGLVMMAKLRDGRMEPVIRSDGTQVILPFDYVRREGPPNRPPYSPLGATGQFPAPTGPEDIGLRP